MRKFSEPSPELVNKVRAVCRTLPEAYEEPASAGTRWRVRKCTIVHVFDFDLGRGPVPAVMFRSTGPELEALRATGYPYLPIYDDGAVMMFIDDNTDWVEVAELVTESYCLQAPKKLVALVERREAARDGKQRRL